jgi:hypothetical protein
VGSAARHLNATGSQPVLAVLADVADVAGEDAIRAMGDGEYGD